MKCSELAEQIRNRLSQKGLVDIDTSSNVSDWDIIESYNICNCCSEKFLSNKKFKRAVFESRSVESFLDLLDIYAGKEF
jgi:hypothetical protein